MREATAADAPNRSGQGQEILITPIETGNPRWLWRLDPLACITFTPYENARSCTISKLLPAVRSHLDG